MNHRSPSYRCRYGLVVGVVRTHVAQSAPSGGGVEVLVTEPHKS